jgi:hypothetical protein
MPWSGGNYTKGNSATGGWTGDQTLGIGIEAGRHDTQDNDFATGINQCLNKDGSNAATGNLNIGGNKITNVAVGTASTDAITLGQAQAGINTSGTGLSITNTRFSADATGSFLTLAKSRAASVGTNTIVQLNDQFGGIVFNGANGTGYDPGAAIIGSVDDTPGATNDMPGALRFYTTPNGSGSLTERMIIKNSGNIGIGLTDPSAPLNVQCNSGAAVGLNLRGRSSDNLSVLLLTENAGTEIGRIQSDTNYLRIQKAGANPIIFQNNATEIARFAGTDGHFCVGTTNDAPAGNNVTGAVVRTDGLIEASRAGTGGSGVGLRINRRTDDGTMVEFIRGVTTVGSISVASGTVSYNAFSGSHWSQLEDGSKPEIPIGTVLESIGEMCEWPNEVEEVLPKVKISDAVASPAVYGVFSAWDNCWDETNDLYVTSLGAFVCRVGAGVTVAIGDLLESNGDGTARVQVGTEIKSSTIGKVTSTHRSHEGVDGSYCVPTVLYCG